MKKRTISIIILLAIVLIISIFVIDYMSKRPDRMKANPYAYDVEEYTHVDPKLINYRETRNFPIEGYKPTGIDVAGGKIWICGSGVLQVILPEGVQVLKTEIGENSSCIKVDGEDVFVGFEDHVEKFNGRGERLEAWDNPGRNCVFTSVSCDDTHVFVADAGNRRVLVYDRDGSLKGEFAGASESAAGHGFIIPSANFDLAADQTGKVWVVNPGKHAIEYYDSEGEMITFWQNSSMEIDGFTGCCNPAEIDMLPNGDFVTSEKGMVRIKIYSDRGKMKSVVAPPGKFEEEVHAPEVSVDEDGTIYALDFDRNMIRVFQKTD